MAKLHEVLAVETGLSVTAKKLQQESIKTLNKDNLFSGLVTTLEMFDDSQKHLNTREVSLVDTTVDENLEYTLAEIAKYWDAVYQKEEANQRAVTDLNVDGLVLAKSLPATFLLGLEAKLAELRKVYEAIPTLPPGRDWVKDETEREGIWKDANDEIRFKTEKAMEFKIAVEATEHHPAQVKEISKVNNVGRLTTHKSSGMLSPLEKANRLSRLDTLLRAVKQARQRANNIDVTNEQVSEKILSYIRGIPKG